MDIDDLEPVTRTQAKLYGLQAVVAAMLIEVFGGSENIDQMSERIMATAMSIVSRYQLRGDSTDKEREIARAMMEAIAMETVTACAHSARVLRDQRPGQER